MIGFSEKVRLSLFFSSTLLVSNVIADEEKNKFISAINNPETKAKAKIIPTYNLYCESMCTSTAIQKSSLCWNLNKKENREKCLQDVEDWEDKCLMECK